MDRDPTAAPPLGALSSVRERTTLTGALAEMRGLTEDFTGELGAAAAAMRGMDKEARSLARSLSSSLRSALDKAIFGGAQLGDVLKDLAADVLGKTVDFALKPLQQALSGGITSLLGSLTGGLVSALGFARGGVIEAGQVRPLAAGGVVAQGRIAPVEPSAGLLSAFAKGGVVAAGRLRPFAEGGQVEAGRVRPGSGTASAPAFSAGPVRAFARGGIVSEPTFFPLRGALGLMGEAGPEAVLPLKRGRDGKLGVGAAPSAGAPTVNITIETPDLESFRRSRGQVAAELARAVSRGAARL
ncbi:MAG: phage tail tape measure protein [Pikeienuella sp.]